MITPALTYEGIAGRKHVNKRPDRIAGRLVPGRETAPRLSLKKMQPGVTPQTQNDALYTVLKIPQTIALRIRSGSHPDESPGVSLA